MFDAVFHGEILSKHLFLYLLIGKKKSFFSLVVKYIKNSFIRYKLVTLRNLPTSARCIFAFVFIQYVTSLLASIIDSIVIYENF